MRTRVRRRRRRDPACFRSARSAALRASDGTDVALRLAAAVLAPRVRRGRRRGRSLPPHLPPRKAPSHAGRVHDVVGCRLSPSPATDREPLAAHRRRVRRDHTARHRVRRHVRAEDVRRGRQGLLRGSAPLSGRPDSRLDADQRCRLPARDSQVALAGGDGRGEPAARVDGGAARARDASRLPAGGAQPSAARHGPGRDRLQPPAARGDGAAERAGDVHAAALRRGRDPCRRVRTTCGDGPREHVRGSSPDAEPVEHPRRRARVARVHREPPQSDEGVAAPIRGADGQGGRRTIVADARAQRDRGRASEPAREQPRRGAGQQGDREGPAGPAQGHGRRRPVRATDRAATADAAPDAAAGQAGRAARALYGWPPARAGHAGRDQGHAGHAGHRCAGAA